MGSLGDKFKKLAGDQTRQLLQNFQNAQSSKSKNGYSYGKLNEDGTATLADGTTVQVEVKGRPGQYAPVFNLGNGQGLVDQPEAKFFNIDNSGKIPWVLCIDREAISIPSSVPPLRVFLVNLKTGQEFDIHPSFFPGIEGPSYPNTYSPPDYCGVFDFSLDGKHIILCSSSFRFNYQTAVDTPIVSPQINYTILLNWSPRWNTETNTGEVAVSASISDYITNILEFDPSPTYFNSRYTSYNEYNPSFPAPEESLPYTEVSASYVPILYPINQDGDFVVDFWVRRRKFDSRPVFLSAASPFTYYYQESSFRDQTVILRNVGGTVEYNIDLIYQFDDSPLDYTLFSAAWEVPVFSGDYHTVDTYYPTMNSNSSYVGLVGATLVDGSPVYMVGKTRNIAGQSVNLNIVGQAVGGSITFEQPLAAQVADYGIMDNDGSITNISSTGNQILDGFPTPANARFQTSSIGPRLDILSIPDPTFPRVTLSDFILGVSSNGQITRYSSIESNLFYISPYLDINYQYYSQQNTYSAYEFVLGFSADIVNGRQASFFFPVSMPAIPALTLNGENRYDGTLLKLGPSRGMAIFNRGTMALAAYSGIGTDPVGPGAVDIVEARVDPDLGVYVTNQEYNVNKYFSSSTTKDISTSFAFIYR